MECHISTLVKTNAFMKCTVEGFTIVPTHYDLIIIFPRNVSFRGYYVFDSNAAAAAAAPPSAAAAASSHHFVVSAITFEGFKLRSSNLTHALFIQISRTSSITDIVVQSKMAAGGHFVQKFQKKKKLRIDLKWQEL